jgi:hypothetical protein
LQGSQGGIDHLVTQGGTLGFHLGDGMLELIDLFV